MSAAAGRLFGSLIDPPERGRFRLGSYTSLAAHTAIVSTLVLGPLLMDEPAPEVQDSVRVALFLAPPPPPPPPPAGLDLARKTAPAVVPDPDPSVLMQPEEPENAPSTVPAAFELESLAAGVANGVDGGTEAGVIGGVLGGAPDGVEGGVGDPVLDFDRGPKLLRKSAPRYPDEAFIQKVQGTVVLEILIDVAGRVVRARVVQSLPLLDATAIETVRQWIFMPAIKNGRPVPTLAMAPVTFTIY